MKSFIETARPESEEADAQSERLKTKLAALENAGPPADLASDRRDAASATSLTQVLAHLVG